MSPYPLLVPDDERLRRHLAQAKRPGRPIGRRTAAELAKWFSESVGPGVQTFLTTGAVTSRLYGELGRLYDIRGDEPGQWLDNLTHFVIRQPLMPTRHRSTPSEPDHAS